MNWFKKWFSRKSEKSTGSGEVSIIENIDEYVDVEKLYDEWIDNYIKGHINDTRGYAYPIVKESFIAGLKHKLCGNKIRETRIKSIDIEPKEVVSAIKNDNVLDDINNMLIKLVYRMEANTDKHLRITDDLELKLFKNEEWWYCELYRIPKERTFPSFVVDIRNYKPLYNYNSYCRSYHFITNEWVSDDETKTIFHDELSKYTKR